MLFRGACLQVQKDEPEHAGQKRGGQDAQLRGRHQLLVGKRQVRHEDGHGESHASQNGRAQHVYPVDVLGQRGHLQLHHDEAEQHDAHGLAHQKAEEHPVEHRVGEHGPQIAADEADVGVRESEQRQDAEVHPRVQLVLQTRGGRHHLARHVAQALHGLEVVLLAHDGRGVVERVARFAHFAARPGYEAFQVDARARGDGERQQHAGNGGMDARHEHAVPQRDAYQEVRHQRVDMAPVHYQQDHEHPRRAPQPEQRRAVAVEDGDDQDGDDVVGHGQRAQEHAHAVGHAVAQKRHDAEREGDVGGGRHAPSMRRVGVAAVERQVDEDRRHHAAASRHDGEQRLANVRQLAHRHLVLDLQAHQKEEHRHEDVVDDVRQRHFGFHAAEEDAHLGLPERKKALVGPRVRHHERNHGGQQHGAGGLGGRMRELDELAVPGLMAFHFLDVDACGLRGSGIRGRRRLWGCGLGSRRVRRGRAVVGLLRSLFFRWILIVRHASRPCLCPARLKAPSSAARGALCHIFVIILENGVAACQRRHVFKPISQRRHFDLPDPPADDDSERIGEISR